MQKLTFLDAFLPLISMSLEILPFTVIWVLFSFIYIFMPNTKVNLRSGIIAGIVAGQGVNEPVHPGADIGPC